jgi:phenylacetic acid degradation protein
MPIDAFENRRPKVGATTYLSPSAQVIGGVTVGECCYVGPGAVLRGDFGAIVIGDETAIEVTGRGDSSSLACAG